MYDNAQANAVMQKALMTLSIWESMTSSRRNAFYSYMETSCNPFKEYYDDDMTEEGEEDMKKVTIQIKVREPLCVRRVQQIECLWSFLFFMSSRLATILYNLALASTLSAEQA